MSPFHYISRHFMPLSLTTFLCKIVEAKCYGRKCFSGQQEVEEHLAIIDCTNNVPFCESALDELEKREGAGTLFAQSIKCYG